MSLSTAIMIPARTVFQVINLTCSWAMRVFHLGETCFHLGEAGFQFGLQFGQVGFGRQVFAFMVMDGLGNTLSLGLIEAVFPFQLLG